MRGFLNRHAWKIRFELRFPLVTLRAWRYEKSHLPGIPPPAVHRYGVELWLDSPAISRTVIDKVLQGRYEFTEAAIASDLVRRGDRVVEFGGGMGFLAIYIARLVGPTGTVTTYEPDPQVVEIARLNIKRNHCQNVDLIHAAVTDSPTESQVYLSSEADFWNRAVATEIDNTTIPSETLQPVPAVNIAKVLADLQPTVLVIDVEGLEHDLLTSGPLPTTIRAIVLEMHDERLTSAQWQATLGSLEGQGFKVIHNFQREFGLARAS